MQRELDPRTAALTFGRLDYGGTLINTYYWYDPALGEEPVDDAELRRRHPEIDESEWLILARAGAHRHEANRLVHSAGPEEDCWCGGRFDLPAIESFMENYYRCLKRYSTQRQPPVSQPGGADDDRGGHDERETQDLGA